jgi:hypothetical protein
MAATTPLVVKADLERRLGAAFITRVFDNNNDGLRDGPTVDDVCADASSKVRGALGLVYDLDDFDPTIATELKRIALDAALAITARDFPGAYPRDWVSLMQQVDLDLKQIRIGISNLGTKDPPEPAANHGVRVTSGNPDDPNCFPKRMSDNWGNF